MATYADDTQHNAIITHSVQHNGLIQTAIHSARVISRLNTPLIDDITHHAIISDNWQDNQTHTILHYAVAKSEVIDNFERKITHTAKVRQHFTQQYQDDLSYTGAIKNYSQHGFVDDISHTAKTTIQQTNNLAARNNITHSGVISTNTNSQTAFTVNTKGKVISRSFGRKISTHDIIHTASVISRILSDTANQVIIWTANSVNFAMSRHSPDNTTALCNIGRMLIKATPDGLFILNGFDETQTAFIDYGRLDNGRRLSRPDSCLMEYAKQGELSVTVTETQSGKAEHYTYTMPDEVADDLTNGRVKFGRGLRSRHFSYRINFTGKMLNIEDAYIDFVPTRRRI